jgi:hypothetical protein
MKNKILIIIFSFYSNLILAHLYITTDFSDGGPSTITKHHIFLHKPYLIKYRKAHYYLTLDKVDKDKVTISSDSYLIEGDNKSFLSGGVWGGKVGETMSLRQYDKKGKIAFLLKVKTDKLIEIKD